MSDIEKIRQEIDRMHQQAVLAAYGNLTDWLKSRIATCVDILAFIDHLPEEPDKSLEEAAEKSAMQYYVDGGYSPFQNIETSAHKVGFIAGAKWQKNQMMKKTVDGEVGYWNQVGLSILLDKSLEKMGYDENTKVKLIIVKED